MAWTYEEASEYNFPNIIVYKKANDGIQSGWRVETSKDYVMYNPNSIEIGYDEADNIIPVYYYYIVKILPLNFNFDNFPWMAVPRDGVDEKYIFGESNYNHEIM